MPALHIPIHRYIFIRKYILTGMCKQGKKCTGRQNLQFANNIGWQLRLPTRVSQTVYTNL